MFTQRQLLLGLGLVVLFGVAYTLSQRLAPNAKGDLKALPPADAQAKKGLGDRRIAQNKNPPSTEAAADKYPQLLGLDGLRPLLGLDPTQALAQALDQSAKPAAGLNVPAMTNNCPKLLELDALAGPGLVLALDRMLDQAPRQPLDLAPAHKKVPLSTQVPSAKRGTEQTTAAFPVPASSQAPGTDQRTGQATPASPVPASNAGQAIPAQERHPCPQAGAGIQMSAGAPDQSPTLSDQVDLNALPSADPRAENGPQRLYLEVSINGHPLDLIAEFKRDNGGMAARAGELRDLGIELPSASGQDDNNAWISLRDLPGGDFRYDAPRQAIDICLDARALALRRYSLWQGLDAGEPLQAGRGAFLNYSLNSELSRQGGEMRSSGLSALLEGWAFYPSGSLHNSLLLQSRADGRAGYTRRLESYFTRSDVARQTNLRLGDLISGGPAWGRPIRLGGVQYRSNFATRPDLIRQPLPAFSGSAAVPSTVDIFRGDVQLARTRVGQGRFELSDIPVRVDNGELRLVVEGPAGDLTEYALAFGTNQALLREGLVSFSLEAGLARRGYGSAEDDYLAKPLLSASFARGVSSALTVEAHGEAGAGLVKAGGGFVRSFGRWGTLNLAVAGSAWRGQRGKLLRAGYTFNAGHFNLGAQTQRRFGEYYDLADITARRVDGLAGFEGLLPAAIIHYDRLFASFLTPRRNVNLGLGYAHTKSAAGEHRHSGTLSLGYPFSREVQFQLRAQANLADWQQASVFAGLSVQLGARYSSQSSLSWSQQRTLASTAISRQRGSEANDYSYSVRLQGNDKEQQAEGRFFRQFARLEGSGQATLSEGQARASGQVRGSLARLNGAFHISRYINNAFLLVDAGYADVLIKHENRGIGLTGAGGMLLVPDILPFESNKISIDPLTLPLAAIIAETDAWVRVPEYAGATVRFKGAEDKRIRVNAYIVRADGKALPAGTAAMLLDNGQSASTGSAGTGEDGRLPGRGQALIIGHDGQLFFSTDKAQNRVRVLTEDGPCLVGITLPEGANGYVDVGERVCWGG